MAVAAPAAVGAAGKAGVAGKAGAGGIKPAQALGHAGRGGGDADEQERRRRALLLLAVPIGFGLVVLLLFCVILIAVFGGARSHAQSGLTNAYPSGSGVPPIYWQMYVSAASHYKVSPYLLASIHYQETRFSTAVSSKFGFNSNGCCAGPMQFNVKGGTWAAYEDAFKPIASERPKMLYPSDRRWLPSCHAVLANEGCVYDDFDAIAAAAKLLHESGADTSLYSSGTKDAVCSYIGSCSEVEHCTGSENQYCEVLPRARKWQQEAETTTSGPTRQRIVMVATRELEKHVHEGAGNCNPYGPCLEWCGMFATWVWEHAGIHIRAAMSREGLSPYYVPDLETYAKNNGLWRSDPAPGDMIIFAGHVGLVTKMLGNGEIAEIGGNQSDAVTELTGPPAGLGEGTPHGYLSPPEGGKK